MSLTIGKLTTAIMEAERFIEVARVAQQRIHAETQNGIPGTIRMLISGSKETAAAKRASMDLSRVLADLRK